MKIKGERIPKLIKDWEEFGHTEESWKSLTKIQRYRIRYPDRTKNARIKWVSENSQYNKDRQRKYQLRDKYGITEDDYVGMLEAQEGKCAICGTDKPTGKWKVFAVDHCHHTGQVRGLLCNECNRGIGLLKDNAELLKKAAAYLEYHKLITKRENEERKSINDKSK